jgi:hypothetical protein
MASQPHFSREVLSHLTKKAKIWLGVRPVVTVICANLLAFATVLMNSFAITNESALSTLEEFAQSHGSGCAGHGVGKAVLEECRPDEWPRAGGRCGCRR